jgi:hypothetical protein
MGLDRIRCSRGGGAMQPQYVLHIQLCELGHIVASLNGYEVSRFGEPSHDNPDLVVPFWCTRLPDYEVHADLPPFPHRDV